MREQRPVSNVSCASSRGKLNGDRVRHEYDGIYDDGHRHGYTNGFDYHDSVAYAHRYACPFGDFDGDAGFYRHPNSNPDRHADDHTDEYAY